MAPEYSVSDEDRKKLEAEFHSKREQDRLSMSEGEFLSKYSNKRIYAIDRGSKQYLSDWLREHCSGKTVLDYCCGLGDTSISLAGMGAEVYGIDIADAEIATAENNAEVAGVTDKTHFEVMDAECMTFGDAMFDVIVCSGVLHHLDLDKAFPELGRVLKPGGQIIAIEALGYNPIINLYRKMTPHLRTAWEMDHILTKAQVKQGLKYFDTVRIKYFHLTTILAVPFRRFTIFQPLLRVFEMIDAVLLKIPGLRLMAWQMIFVYSKNR